MARLIKEWMKAKKGICSSDCECLTITWWRCYAEEHLCNCGDWGSTPPVPGFTYTLEKTSTRGATDTYTASKYDNTNTLVKAYSFSVEYDGGDRIENIKIWDCTWECIWKKESSSNSYSNTLKQVYVNPTEAALTAWTQGAYKDIFDSYEEFYSYDEDYFYCLAESEYSKNDYVYKVYMFGKEEYDISEQEPGSYFYFSLMFKYNSTWDLTEAGIADEDDSWSYKNIQDSSQALALKAEYDSIIANFSQAACKEWFEDAKALYDSLQ